MSENGAGPGRVLLGTQGWNYPDWAGSFYPQGTRPADFLSVYARAFGAVEVDSTFYAVPAVETVRGWARRTPDGFVFALKLPQEVTHVRRLRDAADVVEDFSERARLLGPKLGPVLVQMGPDFLPREWPALERFVPTLPPDLRFAVELRSDRWMERPVLRRVWSLLREHGVALALSDGRWIPRDTVLRLAEHPTADFHYLRWMGPDRAITRFSHVVHDRGAELAAWAGVIRPVTERAVDVFGFVNNHFAGHSPDSVRQLQRLLGEEPVETERLAEQTSLF